MPAASDLYSHDVHGVDNLAAAHGCSAKDPFRTHAVCAAMSIVDPRQMGRYLDTVDAMLLFRRGLHTNTGEPGSCALWSDFSGYSLARGHLARFNRHVMGMYTHGATSCPRPGLSGA